MTDNKIEFKRVNNLTENFVMIDAIGRSGKGMLAHIIGSFKGVEKQYNLDTLEWVGILWQHGKISTDAAKALIQVEVDTRLYNSFIGRSINVRPTDDTSIFKNGNINEYLKRLFLPAESDAVDRILSEKPIMQTCIHDGIRNAELYFDAFKDCLKLIYIVRDPLYIIHEWVKSDFGRRIGSDPREFQLTTNWEGEVVPYTAIGWESEYLKINEVERVIALIAKHFELNMKSIDKLDSEIRKNIKVISFEKLVTDPIPVCNELAEFLGTELTLETNAILAKENCPRILTAEDRNDIIENLKSNISDTYKTRLDEIVADFENFKI